MHPNIQNVCLQNKHFVYLGAYISKSKLSQNANPSLYYFYMNVKILADFRICISVPLTWYHLIKPQKRCSVCKGNHCRLDSPCICQRTSRYLCSICEVFHGYFSLGKTSGPTTKAAGSEVRLNVRSRCISQEGLFSFEKIIVRESANVKVCQHQVMISNGLFEETN